MEEYICCFTGHREIAKRHAKRLPLKLERGLEYLYGQGVRVFRAGGALGFDTLAALSVIEFRKTHSDVKLHLMLPCRDQEKYWGFRSKIIYKQIIRKSDEVEYVADKYTRSCMFERNRRMVDGAHVCMAYYDGGNGGTAYTYSYAKKKGIKVMNLYDSLDKEE